MTISDKIRELCNANHISVTNLEQTLGFGNGSLTKSSTKSIKADRLLSVAQYFHVSMEYLMDAQEPDDITSKFDLAELDMINKFAELTNNQKLIVISSVNEFSKYAN